jgi:hypothetical protein
VADFRRWNAECAMMRLEIPQQDRPPLALTE